jgi:uncharacterized protein YaiI (UPF0178 family)
VKILVDADACPNPIKEILFRAANRTNIQITLVANQPISIPKSPYIKFIQVGHGIDVADKHIENMVETGDLVITADVPLAALVVAKDGFALNPRGQLYDNNNIQQKLGLRNFMMDLRSSGELISGPSPLNKKDLLEFANALNSFLSKVSKNGNR